MLGMYFGNLHTYEDFNVFLSEVEIPPATPKTNFVDIPGGDGSADLTAALGRVFYNDRECTFKLSVRPGDDYEQKKTEISNKINGQRQRLRLDKDPGFYYVGRCCVSEYKSEKRINSIVVTATVSPYKLKLSETMQEYQAGISGQQRLFLGCGVAVIPSIITESDCILTVNGGTYHMNEGTHIIPDFELLPGENTFGLESTGKVIIKYQERDL